jgi:hypothetical protein
MLAVIGYSELGGTASAVTNASTHQHQPRFCTKPSLLMD